jgi:hypothetical protein
MADFRVPVQRFSGKKEDFEAFALRFESCMAANEITDNQKQVHTFIACMGDELFKLVHDLFAPAKVTDQTFADVVAKIKAHVNPAPNVITARCTFNRCTQKTDQDISSFIATLRRLAEDCKYAANLNEWLRDRFVAGLHSESIRRRLLQEKADMKFDGACKIAIAYETASREARCLQVAAKPVNAVRSKPETRKFEKWRKPSKSADFKGSAGSSKPYVCIRCKSTEHKADKCPHRGSECHACGKKGHIRKACLAKSTRPGNSGQTTKMTKLVEQTEDDTLDLYAVEQKTEHCDKIFRRVGINGQRVKFEVDTGAAVTIINYKRYKKHFAEVKLGPSNTKLRGYSGQDIAVRGEICVEVVTGKGEVKTLDLLVVEGDGPSLIG